MDAKILVMILAVFTLSCIKDDVISPTKDTPDSNLKFSQSPYIVINELCASNAGNITDEFNEDPDWIELYNKSDTAINLKGYGLSDESVDIFKWKFGNVIIKPHQYLLIFASGKNIFEMKEPVKDDTISFISVGSWSDLSVGGNSTVEPNEYGAILSVDERGKKVISAVITLGDNYPDMEWCSANITVGFSRQQKTQSISKYDFSMYNALRMNMTLEKNKTLCIRLLQGENIDSWKAPLFKVKGTGIKNDTYTLPLIQNCNGLDLKNITGIFFESVPNTFTPVPFTIKDMLFVHTGYNLHTNLKLSKTKSRLYICRPDSVILDTVSISQVPPDMSMGKVKEKWVLLNHATPGLENVQQYYTSISQMPIPVTRGGFYDNPVSVTLNSIDSGDIHYTTNGSVPAISSKKYSGPIQIDSTTILRFVSIKDGQLISKVQTETYFIKVTTKLPVISISTESGALFDQDTGIYMTGPNATEHRPEFGANFWSDKEVPVHIQFFESDKTARFAADAGISIIGNWSRDNLKKSLGIKFKEKYGLSHLDYPLFPQYPNLHKFQKIVLRNNGGNFGRAMIEDPMMQSLMDDRNIDYQKYRPVVVFINGQYFGLYQLMEAANSDYVYTNYGLNEDQIDFYDALGFIKQGTSANWKMLDDYLLSQLETKVGITAVLQDSAYAMVKQYMDVFNFIDYVAFEIFINNTDWPANNCRWWRSHSNGKWRWLIYDTDFGFGSVGYISTANDENHNTLEFALCDTTNADDWPNGYTWTFLLRALLQNQSFKEDFINRFATLIATNFNSDRVKSRIDQMAGEIKDEIDIDYPRMGFSIKSWQTNVKNLKLFADKRPELVYKFIQQHSQFGITGTYNITVNNKNGMTYINDMSVKSASFTGKYFSGIPVRLKAIPLAGRQFKMWSDGNVANPRTINSETDITIDAIYE